MKHNVVRNDWQPISAWMWIVHDNPVKGDARVSTVC